MPNTQLSSKVGILWKKYLSKLQSDPLLTKSLTSGILSALGDLLAQLIEKRFSIRSCDPKKVLEFGQFGLIVSGPIFHFWYKFIEKFFSRYKSSGIEVVLLKILAEQIILRPIFFSLLFLYTSISQGTTSQIGKKIQKDLIPTWLTSMKVSVPTAFISYKFVPPEMRVLFGSIVALVWNIYFRLKFK